MYRGELAQKILRPEEDLAELNRLIVGLENTYDPVTWRTAVIQTRKFFTPKDVDGDFVHNLDKHPPGDEFYDQTLSFIENILQDTPLEKMLPEFLTAVYELDHNPGLLLPALDTIMMNGRHLPEELLYGVARELEQIGNSTAVINPVGHYGDRETRLVATRRLHRDVEQLVILASTQAKDGGDFGVFAQAMDVLDEPLFANHISRMDIVIPKFGGARSHTRGQSYEVGKEIYQAARHAEMLSLSLRASINRLQKRDGKVPEINFYSVDIHNKDLPYTVFEEHGFPFKSILPASEFAQASFNHLQERQILKYPLQVIAADKGAIFRTDTLAEELLRLPKLRKFHDWIDVVYIDKDRVRAGEVGKSTVEKVSRFRIESGQVSKNDLVIDNAYWLVERTAIMSDDMIDRVGTQESGGWLVRGINRNLKYLLSAATHGVCSDGSDNLNKAPVDHYLISNTLRPDGLTRRRDVTIVDVAPAIARTISS